MFFFTELFLSFPHVHLPPISLILIFLLFNMQKYLILTMGKER